MHEPWELAAAISERYRHSGTRIKGVNLMAPHLLGTWRVGRAIVEVAHDNGEWGRVLGEDPPRIRYGVTIRTSDGRRYEDHSGGIFADPEDVLDQLVTIARGEA